VDRRLIDYIPPILRDIREFLAIMQSEQPEVENAWSAADDLWENQYISSAGELGVSRWESILGITPKATATLDERKFEILAMLNAKLPYTMTELKKQLSMLCGDDGYSVELDNDGYTLMVLLALTAKNNYNAVVSLLEEIAPANLILTVNLKYNQHLTFAGRMHGEMKAYTHYDLRNEVV